MNIKSKIFSLITICILASGCATKTLQVTIPAPATPQTEEKGVVKISSITDKRQFQRSPEDPAIPSIEGDFIDDKAITDKVVGRMRHGLYHKSLWNYTLKGDDDIYDVCRKVATNSLTEAGYKVVTPSDDNYSSATAVDVDILQFWAWMQPKFNIDLHFDGELHIKSTDGSKKIDAKATGGHMFSTGFAGGGAWEKLINTGAKDLQDNLTKELTK